MKNFNYKKVFILLVFAGICFFIFAFVQPIFADTAAEPNIVVKDIDIDPATRKVMVTVENTGAPLHYQKTMWIYAKDLDTGKEFAGMLTSLNSGVEKTYTLTDNWILNVDYEEVEERESGKYKMKAWVEDSVVEKTVEMARSSIRELEITNIEIPGNEIKTNSVKISWKTNITATSTVARSEPAGGVWPEFKATDNGMDHSIILQGLQTNTKYSFYIKCGATDARKAYSSHLDFVTKPEEGMALADLTIKDIAFSPKPLLNQAYSGKIKLTVANLGNAVARASNGIYVMFHLEGGNAWGDHKTINDLGGNSQQEVCFDLKDKTFTKNPLKISAWIDSNSMERDGKLVNDNLSIMESNEDNNTLYKEITLSSDAAVDLFHAINIKSEKMNNRLKGKILLKVEDNGKAYYVNPNNNNLYYLGRPNDAFSVMRQQGIGITNQDLSRIPVGVMENGNDTDGDGLPDYLENSLNLDFSKDDTDGDGYKDGEELQNGYNPWGPGKQKLDNSFTNKQKGKILLQIEKNGEAWYVNPTDGKRYFLGRPSDAFRLMKQLSTGISNADYASLNME